MFVLTLCLWLGQKSSDAFDWWPLSKASTTPLEKDAWMMKKSLWYGHPLGTMLNFGGVSSRSILFKISFFIVLWIGSTLILPHLPFLSRWHRAPHCGALAMSGASVVSVRSKGVWYDPTIPLLWTNGLGIKPLRRQTSNSTLGLWESDVTCMTLTAPYDRKARMYAGLLSGTSKKGVCWGFQLQ